MNSNSNYPISKTAFIKGCQCIKAFYLYRHTKNEGIVNNKNGKAIKVGFKFEHVAQQYFKNGVNTYKLGKDSSERIILTKQFVSQGTSIIYEACFEQESCMCATDIIVKEKDGWHGYEIKSSKHISYYQILDAAYQYYVIKASGLDLTNFSCFQRCNTLEIFINYLV